MNRNERIFAAPIVTLLVLTLSQISCGQSTQQSNERFYVKRPEGTSYKVIVSADGGGFRGLISSYILIELEDTIKRHILVNLPELLPESNRIESIEDFEVSLADYVDCFTGSSAGSWTSLYLASKGGNGIAANIFNEKRFIEKYGVIAPGAARGLLVLYNEYINGVFPQDLVNAFNSNTNPDPIDPGVLTPVIPENEAKSVFNGFYGRTTLSELSTSCMITGYDLITRSPILFVHDKFGTTPKTGFTRLIRRSSPRSRNMTFMSDIEGNYGVDYFISDIAIGSSAVSAFVSLPMLLPAKGEADRMIVLDGGTSYKVLVSADAGGFRGLISSYILIELEDTIKRHILVNLPELLPESNLVQSIEGFEVSLADFVDCFTGSSAGSWTSLYLASKRGNGIAANIFNEKRFIEKYGVIASGSARGLLVLYNEYINGVFPQDLVTAFTSNTNPGPSDPGVLTPVIPENEAKSVFNGFYDRTTLSELSTSCMITGYDLITRSPILFVHDKFGTTPKTGFTRLIRRSSPRTRNMTFMSDIEGNYGLDYYISDLAIGSSTAVPLIPSHVVLPAKGKADRMIILDGGIYRTDPSLLAFTQIVNSTGASSYLDIAILSISGGIPLYNLVASANGGANQWDNGSQRMFYTLFTGMEISNKQLELFYYSNPDVNPGQYLRVELYGQPETELNTLLNEGAGLSTELAKFATIGQQFAATYRVSIESFFGSFIFG
eukprot:g4255.t1